MPRIENYSVWNGMLVGRVYDHPKLPNGEQIITTPLKFIDYDKKEAHTKNNVYTLGVPYVTSATMYAALNEGDVYPEGSF